MAHNVAEASVPKHLPSRILRSRQELGLEARRHGSVQTGSDWPTMAGRCPQPLLSTFAGQVKDGALGQLLEERTRTVLKWSCGPEHGRPRGADQ